MGASGARLGFAIVGGVIGAFFGFPALGFLAGSLIGGLIFPVEGPTIEGPRLDDLAVSSSANGNPIGMGGGTMRMPAEVIDGTEIEEERREEDVGGKGGMSGGGTQVTYRYYANLFLSFGEPLKRSIKGGKALAITQFFADGKKTFDNSATNLDIQTQVFAGVTSKGGTGTDGFQYRFYNGGETQLPDPFFENLHGVGNVPGYRGQVCLAIERWPLEDYGNRIPVMTAVIAYDGTIANEVRAEISLAGRGAANGAMGVNFDFQRAYSTNNEAGGDSISEIDLTTLTELRRGEVLETYSPEDENDVPRLTTLHVAPLSGLIVAEGGGMGGGFGTNAQPVVSIDPLTLRMNGRLGRDGALARTVTPTFSDPFGNIESAGGGAINDLVAIDGSFQAYFFMANQKEFAIFRVFGEGAVNPQTPSTGALVWVWGGDTDTVGKRDTQDQTASAEGDFTARCRGRILRGSCEFIAVTADNATWPAAVYKVTVLPDSSYAINSQVFPLVKIEVINSDLEFVNGGADVCRNILYDQTDQTHILFIDESSTANDALRLIKIDSDGDVVWDTGTLVGYGMPSGTLDFERDAAFIQSRIVNNFVCLASKPVVGLDGIYTLNTVSGEVTAIESDTSGDLRETYAIDTITGSMIQSVEPSAGTEQFFCGRVTGEGITLGEINRNVADRAGYETAVTTDVDFNALDVVTIPGIGMKRQMQAVAAVRGLLPAYAYEIVEVDHKIKGIFLDKASALTIDADTLLPQGQEIKQLLLEERTDDQQIPARVNVVYADPALDYESGNQPAKRIRDPRPTTRSISEKSVQLPVAETATKAYEIAEQMLWRAYVERRKLLFNSDWELLRLSGSDVITITDDGNAYVVRIIEMIVGKDFTIRFKSVSHESPVFSPSDDSALTDGGTHIAQTINPSAVSTLSFLDTAPLLRDADSSTTVVPVYYGCFATPEFNNSTIYKQDPSGAWHDIDRCTREIVKGFTINPLAAPAFGAFFTDEDSQLEVQIVEGSTDLITSQTDQEFRDNGLVFLVGSEVVGVRDVAQQTDGSFVLTGLHRGLLGTEGFTDTHTDAETIYLLDASVLMVNTEPNANIGATASFKAVNDNQSFELAPTVSHTTSGVPLLPYAVASLEAVDSAGDIDITWSARSRLTSDMRDGVAAYNESEPTVSYEVDIVASGVIVRTIAATTESATYTADQQTTDFGGSAGAITINVYKLNTAVGRGRLESISHVGLGGDTAVRPSIIEDTAGPVVTEHAKETATLNVETFNVTPGTGTGTTMLCLWIAYNSVTASGPADDIRFLDFQGDSYVRFAGQDMAIIDAHPIMDATPGNFTGVGNLFYLLNPGTTEGAIEVKFPDSLTARSFIMSAFTIQDVNPSVPFGTPRSWDTRLLPVAGTDEPAWPSNANQWFSDEAAQYTAWLKDFDGDTLGLSLQMFHDERKGQDFNVGPGAQRIGFGTASGATTGDTAVCGYRAMSIPMDGDINDILTSSYMAEEFNTTQPRDGIALNIEVNGV